MANSPYLPPSVSITEDVQVNVQPILERPTSIAIVGETLGYLTYTETVFLNDINEVTLKQSGIDASSVVVVSALDPSGTAFVATTDYVLSAADTYGNRTLKRNVFTTIPTETDLAVIYTNGNGTPVITTTVGQFVGFDPTINTDPDGAAIANGADRLIVPASDVSDPTNPISIPDGDTITAVSIQAFGQYRLGDDYTTNHVSDTHHTITRVAPGNLISKQKVYVTYSTDTGFYENEVVTMTGTAAQDLAHDDENVDEDSIIVTNSPHGTAADLAVVGSADAPIYTAGASSDYIVTTLPDTAVAIDRNLGSAQGVDLMGYATNNIAVRVTYNATPTDYYAPTRFFSLADVEAKFGVALDSNGNINSPASFGAYMAFMNLASDVVVQPLFHSVDSDLLTSRTRTASGTYSGDWALSFKALRDLTDVNVIVPVFARTSSSGAITDSVVSTIFAALMAHINYMAGQQQYVVGLMGEDSTIAGLASQAVLQAHARSILGGSVAAERAVLVSPASFAFANPQSGTQVRIGGQYVAAACAGMLAARPIQVPLTRKSVSGITGVVDIRSESDKNADASAGLMVVEAKNGLVRVRHAITTAVNNANTRELSVIRAKNFMVESIKTTIDDQLIGQIIADSSAPFTVSTTVQGVLEALIAGGVIVDFAGLQSRSLAPVEPTKIEVRFSYKPSFPLNYVSIVFSIDTSTGAIDASTANTNI